MSKVLLKTEETYRADLESEATELIDEAKADKNFTLSKFTSVKRQKKEKGEVVDEWYKVTLTKMFTDEKEPDKKVTVEYNTMDNFEFE